MHIFVFHQTRVGGSEETASLGCPPAQPGPERSLTDLLPCPKAIRVSWRSWAVLPANNELWFHGTRYCRFLSTPCRGLWSLSPPHLSILNNAIPPLTAIGGRQVANPDPSGPAFCFVLPLPSAHFRPSLTNTQFHGGEKQPLPEVTISPLTSGNAWWPFRALLPPMMISDHVACTFHTSHTSNRCCDT